MEGDIGTLSPPPCLAQGDLKEADSKPIVMNTALSLSFNTDIDDALEVLSRQPQEENFFPSKDQNSSLLPLNDGRISVNPYTAPAVAPSVGSLDLRAQRVEKPLDKHAGVHDSSYSAFLRSLLQSTSCSSTNVDSPNDLRQQAVERLSALQREASASQEMAVSAPPSAQPVALKGSPSEWVHGGHVQEQWSARGEECGSPSHTPLLAGQFTKSGLKESLVTQHTHPALVRVSGMQDWPLFTHTPPPSGACAPPARQLLNLKPPQMVADLQSPHVISQSPPVPLSFGGSLEQNSAITGSPLQGQQRRGRRVSSSKSRGGPPPSSRTTLRLPDRGLRAEVLALRRAHPSYANAHRPETVSVPDLLEKLLPLRPPDHAHSDAHRRETVPVPDLSSSLRALGRASSPHESPSEGGPEESVCRAECFGGTQRKTPADRRSCHWTPLGPGSSDAPPADPPADERSNMGVGMNLTLSVCHVEHSLFFPKYLFTDLD